jgi:hypothetical protein
MDGYILELICINKLLIFYIKIGDKLTVIANLNPGLDYSAAGYDN